MFSATSCNSHFIISCKNKIRISVMFHLCGTNLHHILVDLLGVSVDQIDLLGVAVLLDFLLVGVVLVLVRHGQPSNGRGPRSEESRACADSAVSSVLSRVSSQ